MLTPGNGTRIVATTRLPVKGAGGKPQYLISVIRDLTESKQSTSALADQKTTRTGCSHHQTKTGQLPEGQIESDNGLL